MSAPPVTPNGTVPQPATAPSILSTASALPEPILMGEPVNLSTRVEIFPQVPLPYLNSPAGPAFAARLKGDSKASLYAIICSEPLPWNNDVLGKLLGKQHTNMIRFRDSGMVDWPGGTTAGPISGKRVALIHERPAGIRVGTAYQAGLAHQPRIDTEKLLTLLIKPLVDLAANLFENGIAHGSLHLDNLYLGPNGVIQAGDCVSFPASYETPPVYLTIERAQALPAARGPAHLSDDLYAIAVSALIMTLGFNPVAHMSDEELLRARLERGSFIAILGEHSLKGMATELFRSLLEDDPRRRWNLEDIETWLEGRRPTPKTIEGDAKPKRPLILGDDSSATRRGAAHIMSLYPLKAAALAESGELQRWIERSIDNESLTKRAKTMFDRAHSTARGPATPSTVVAARAAILIDPYGPVRYKETAIMPPGFGTLLASRLMTGGDIQPLVEILQAELTGLWADGQTDNRAEYIAAQQALERAQLYIDRKVIGYGVERALYELMPAQACLSPMIRNYNAQNIPQALVALNSVAANMGTQQPVDRHIAAFLVARDRRIHEGLLATLAAPEKSIKRVVGTLSLLAEAQYRHGPAQLKELAQWMLRLLEPATKRFFEKAMQEKCRRDLAAAAQKGDLIDMVNLLDSPEAIDEDRAGFEDARVIWQQAEEDIIALQDDIDKRGEVERRVGQPLASGLAVVLGIVAIGFVIVLSFIGSLP